MGDLIADIYRRRMTHTERFKEFANENKIVVTVFLMLLLILAITSFHSMLLLSSESGQSAEKSTEGYAYIPANKSFKEIPVHENILTIEHGILKVPPKPISSKRAQDHPGLNSPF